MARRTRGPLAAALADRRRRRGLLAELSAGPPTVLLVEDLHWADEATLDLLAFVARRIGDLPAAVVLTYRDDEVGRASPLRRLLGAAPSAVRVALRPAVAERGDRARAATGPSRCTCTAARGQPVPRHRAPNAGGRLPASISEAVLGRLTRLSEASRRSSSSSR